MRAMMYYEVDGIMKAKKYYGQNFLKNEEIIKNITDLVNPSENDLIIEIGPGRGALTKYLTQKTCDLVCIEIDTDLKVYLDKYQSEKCKIIYVDILNVDLNEITKAYQNVFVVGNLPYYITSPILEYLINSIKAQKMVFMVQKEVADRYSAKVNTKDYGYFTLFLNFYYEVNKEIFVGKNNFDPVPKVDSEVISLSLKDKVPDINPEKYFAFLKECFSHKRKTLKNNIISYDYEKIMNVLNKYGLTESVRAEQIREDIFIEIFKSLEC